MRIQKQGTTVKLWLSAEDTYQWANKPGGKWPCSYLAGKALFAEFRNGDLVDYAVEGETENFDLTGDEFNAITGDFINADKQRRT